MINKIWYWLVISSNDPTKYSLTIKAFLINVVTFLTVIGGLANIQVGDLTPIVDSIVVLVQSIFTIISTLVFIFGFVRKLYKTWTGEHNLL